MGHVLEEGSIRGSWRIAASARPDQFDVAVATGINSFRGVNARTCVRRCVIGKLLLRRRSNRTSRRCVRWLILRNAATFSRRKRRVIRVYATGRNTLLRRLSYRREIRPGENNALCAAHKVLSISLFVSLVCEFCPRYLRHERTYVLRHRRNCNPLRPLPPPRVIKISVKEFFESNRICRSLLRNLIIRYNFFASSLRLYFFLLRRFTRVKKAFFEIRKEKKRKANISLHLRLYNDKTKRRRDVVQRSMQEDASINI